MHNFFLIDISGAMLAAILFFFVLYTPGAVTAWLLNLNGYRSLSLASRAVISIPLSFSLVIVLIWLCGAGSLRFAIGCLVAVNCGFVAIAVREVFFNGRRSSWMIRKKDILPAAFVIVWCLLVALTIVDVQIGQHLFQSVTLRDASYRIAFIQSVIRSGTPPLNPLYSTGHASVMRNYYFWYVVCAIVVKFSALTAKQVLIASSMWSSAALLCLPPLYFRGFFAVRTGLRRLSLIAFGLFTITGLDLIVVVHRYIYGGTIDADMEWWDRDHFSSWFDPLLYAPHHIAGLVCCLFGFLLLWQAADRSWRDRAIALTLAGMAFASSSGLSIYICAAFAMTLIPWCLWAFFREKQTKLVATVLLAGIVSLLAASPYLYGLKQDQGQTLATVPRSETKTDVSSGAPASEPSPDTSPGVHGEATQASASAVTDQESSAEAADETSQDSSGLDPSSPASQMDEKPLGSVHHHKAKSPGFHLPFMLQLRRIVAYRDLTDYLQSVPFLEAFVKAHYKLVQTVDWFIVVIPVYFLEFGFYCVVMWLLVSRWRRERRRLSVPTRHLLFLMTTSLIVTTVVRSSVININDFGLRSALIPQFCLLLVATLFFAELPETRPSAARFNHSSHLSHNSSLLEGSLRSDYATAPSQGVRRVLYSMMVLGFLACVYQATIIRIYLPLVESRQFPLSSYVYVYPEMSRKLFAMRTAYGELDRKIPAEAVLQYNPYRGENYFLWANMMAAGHQLAAGEPECGADFGGDPTKCPGMLRAIVKMFAWPAPSAQELKATCERLGIDYAVGSVEDDAWSDAEGWVWHSPLIVAEPGIRIVRCNDRTPPPLPPNRAWLR